MVSAHYNFLDSYNLLKLWPLSRVIATLYDLLLDRTFIFAPSSSSTTICIWDYLVHWLESLKPSNVLGYLEVMEPFLCTLRKIYNLKQPHWFIDTNLRLDFNLETFDVFLSMISWRMPFKVVEFTSKSK